MTTAVALTDALAGLSQEEILAGLNSSIDESQVASYKYLKFDGRSGMFLVMNNTDEPDKLDTAKALALSILGSTKSMVCWKDDEVVDFTPSISLFVPLPPVDALEDHGPYEDKRDGWVTQFALLFANPETEEQYLLKLSSISARKAAGQLLKDIAAQAPMHDLKTEAPVIKFGAESFKSNGFKNYKPKFTLTEWVTMAPVEVTHAPAAAAITDQSEGTDVAADDAELPTKVRRKV